MSYHSASQWLLGADEGAGYADLREFDKHEGSPAPLGPGAAAGDNWGGAARKKASTNNKAKAANPEEEDVCCCKPRFLLATTVLMSAVAAVLFGLWTAQVPLYVPTRAGVFDPNVLLRVNNTGVTGTSDELFAACGRGESSSSPAFLSLTVAWSASSGEFSTREEWSGGLTIKTRTTLGNDKHYGVSVTTTRRAGKCSNASAEFFGQALTPQVWALRAQVASVARPGGGDNVTLFSGVLNERIVGALSDSCIAKTFQVPPAAGAAAGGGSSSSSPSLVIGYCDGDYLKPCPALPAMVAVPPSGNLATLRPGTVAVTVDAAAVAKELAEELC